MRLIVRLAWVLSLVWLSGALLAEEEVTWKEKACLTPETNIVAGVQFSADGKQILAFGHNAIVVFNVEEGKEVHRLEMRDRGSYMALLIGDGNKVLINPGNYFAFHDLKSKKEEPKFQYSDDRIEKHYCDVALSTDGNKIALSGKTHSATLLDAK